MPASSRTSLLFSLCLGLGLLTGCSGNADDSTPVACGAGTIEVDGACVLDEGSAGHAGSATAGHAGKGGSPGGAGGNQGGAGQSQGGAGKGQSGQGPQAGAGQAGSGQAGKGQGNGGTNQGGAGQSQGGAGNGQAGAGSGGGPAGSGQAGSGQAGSGQAGSGQAGSAQAGSGQSGSGQAGSGQAGAGQGGSGEEQDLATRLGVSTEIQGILRGTNLPAAPSTLRFDLFPDFTLPSELWVSYGESPSFAEWAYVDAAHPGDCVPCRKGWTATDAEIYGPEVGAARRSGWGQILSNDAQLQEQMASTGNSGQQQAYGAQGWDVVAWNYDPSTMQDAGVHVGSFSWDNEESAASNADFAGNYIKGFVDAANAAGVKPFFFGIYGRNLPGCIYGVLNNHWYDGQPINNEAFWPTFDKEKRDQCTHTDAIAESMKQTDGQLLYDFDNYPTDPLPETVSMYEKNADGSFRKGSDGRRVFKTTDFHETIRNSAVTWRGTDGNGWARNEDGNIIMGDQPGCGASFQRTDGSMYCDGNTASRWHQVYKPESYFAAHGVAISYTKYIFSLLALNRALHGSEDLESTLYGNAISTQSTISPISASFNNPTEPGPGNTPGMNSIDKPISPYQTTFNAWLALSMLRSYNLWTGLFPVSVKAGKGFYPPKMGEGYPSFNVNDTTRQSMGLDQADLHQLIDLSVYEHFTAVNYEAALINQKYGLFGGADKRLVFTEPSAIQDGEILGFGRLQGNLALVVLAEPLLDVGESMTVTLRTKQGFSREIVLNPGGVKEVFVDVIELPPGPSYAAADLYLDYTTLASLQPTPRSFKTTGNLLQHNL